ncbi:hypothetical protein [Candidatus Phytoplasma citri]|uniref:Uncharacterized protein n=2 Tax=Candidatus Phytoplasma citri TaxID=180978 RepID=A0A1S9M065_9MOLU|nr:hypothetical protein [Candidatus Phytoplasma aurantifolia]OOP58572.1 hypothetical protein B2G44_01690 [Candidatus Phytoplasma aurantifolia]
MNFTSDKNILYKILLFFIIFLILLGQIFFIMNVLAHNEEIEEEHEKLSQTHKQLLENYNKIQNNNKIKIEPILDKNNNINSNKNSLKPILNSLQESIELQKKFFQPKTNSFDFALKKLTDEAAQSIIVFKNNKEEKIDHIKYFNKFGELISKIFLNNENNYYKQIEEYQNNQLFKKTVFADDYQSELISFYKNNKIKTEILNVYNENTKNFITHNIAEFDDEEKLITTSFYQKNAPYKIDQKIYWDNKQNPIKIENFKYIGDRLNAIEEFNANQQITKVTIFNPNQQISSIKEFKYITNEVLIETKFFDSNNKLTETKFDVKTNKNTISEPDLIDTRFRIM